MNDAIIIVAIAVVVGIVSFFLTNYFARRAMQRDRELAREETKKIISEAENEAKIKKKEAVLEAREEWLKVKSVCPICKNNLRIEECQEISLDEVYS